MKRVCLCVSDAHAGIQAAVKKELLGASWQRCKVHFMRNILAKVPHKEKRRFAAHLKQIWLQPDRKSARRTADQLAQEYGGRFPEAIRCLEEGLEDSLLLPHGIFRGLEERSQLYQTGEGPGGHGAKPNLPDGSSSQLKRLTMASNLRTYLDTT
jgi:hypothetical protein